MTCSSYQIDDWKSTELVILEGVTKSFGSLLREILEKGSISMNPIDWVLVDRWFNYKLPLIADIELNSIFCLAGKFNKLKFNIKIGNKKNDTTL